jgi:hypothetical protein
VSPTYLSYVRWQASAACQNTCHQNNHDPCTNNRHHPLHKPRRRALTNDTPLPPPVAATTARHSAHTARRRPTPRATPAAAPRLPPAWLAPSAWCSLRSPCSTPSASAGESTDRQPHRPTDRLIGWRSGARPNGPRAGSLILSWTDTANTHNAHTAATERTPRQRQNAPRL